MTPLDVAIHDAAKTADHCTIDRCVCPTCSTTAVLLRSMLTARGVLHEDASRVAVRANDFRGGEHPHLASVLVDGRETYRIMQRPDEVFEPDVMADIQKALRRPL